MSQKQQYELPLILPNGWRKEVAKALNIHRNSVYNAIQRGGKDPLYLRIIECTKKKYGKPVKIEKDESR